VEKVKQMEYEKLYTLLHSLSVQEKKNLTIFIKGNEDTLTYLLYTRIKKTRSLDKTAKDKVKGQEFADSHQFHRYRMYVAEWVIKSILQHNEPEFSIERFIKSAFLYEANGLAKKTLQSEMRRMQAIEDFKSMRLLYNLISELEVFHSISIALSEDILPSQEVEGHLKSLQLLFEFDRELKSVARKNVKVRTVVATKILKQLLPSYGSLTNTCLANKIRMNIAYFHGNHDLALTFGTILINSFHDQEGKLLRIWELKAAWVVRQYRFNVILNLVEGNRNDAIQYSLEMSKISPSSPSERTKVLKSQILIGASVAVFYAEGPLAEQCLGQLEQHFEIFDSFELCKVYYNLGMAFFYNLQYEKAVKCFQMSRNEVTIGYDFLRWEPQLLLALSHFELGNIEAADSFLGSAKREVIQSELRYPQETIKIIEKYLDDGFRDDQSVLILTNSLQAIANIISDPEEKRCSNWFSLVVWATAKIESVSAKDVYLRLSAENGLNERILLLA
jgi:tetratricopeptide (TPR) repeat protein